ncbi:MAG: serine/threonine protein kinase [Myxococcales bacterium]|nr:serine/threonine protein kinase [Myxococcales bacterium]
MPTPPGDDAPGEATPTTAVGHMVRAAPVADPLERAVARAKAAEALFGEAAAVKVGRYRLIERAGAGGMGVVWSAWDPELNRGVALKLASAGDDDARARARDEGRALARLSHPNVVPIYDVFEAPEGVFLVMELVKGKTLRTIATDGAPVAELLRAYRQCGEGLAAAHAAGLVHRDFKPDNAILGADGRVRVLDFGLAHATDDTGAPLIAGTPRYMAPEQKRGDALTAAVDQYALCVALREAVAARGPTPRWLEPILTRGSAERPADRFPSMAALLAALALDPAARWRRRGMIGAGVITAGAITVALVGRRSVAAPPPCQGGEASIAGAWGGARRTAANTFLAGLPGDYARESVPRIVAALDRYADDWVIIQRASCMAHQRGEVSTAAFDRRTACLARRKAALTAVADVAASATTGSLPDLVIASLGLPDLATCDDDDALLSPVAPPTATQAPEAAAIADLIAKVDVERDAGRTDQATRDAESAVARAEALGYQPLIARALLARGRIPLSLMQRDRGRVDFAEAARRGLEVGDEPLAIEAYARAAFAFGTTANPAEATAGLPLVEAIATRLGERAAFPRALLDHNVGVVELARGDRTRALPRLRASRAESARLTGSAAIEMAVVLQSLMFAVDDAPERDALGKDLVAARLATLGPGHPLTLEADLMRSGVMTDFDQGRLAMRAPCERLAALHPDQRTSIRECGHELAWRAAAVGDRDASIAGARLVLAAATPDANDSRITRAKAYLAIANGDPDAALSVLADLKPIGDDRPWWQRMINVDNGIVLAQAELARSHAPEARRALDHAAQLAQGLLAAAPIDLRHRLDAIAAIRRRLP